MHTILKRSSVILLISLMILCFTGMISLNNSYADDSRPYQRVGAFYLTGYGDISSEALSDKTAWCTKIGTQYFWAWANNSYDDSCWTISKSNSLTGERTRIKKIQGHCFEPSVISNGSTIYYADEGYICSINVNGNNQKWILYTDYYDTKVVGCYNGVLYYTTGDDDYYDAPLLYSYDLETEEEEFIGYYDVGDCYGRYLICSSGYYNLCSGEIYIYDVVSGSKTKLPVSEYRGTATVNAVNVIFFDGKDIKSCDYNGQNVRTLHHVYDSPNQTNSPGMFFWMNDIAAAYGYWNESENVETEYGVYGIMPMHKYLFADAEEIKGHEGLLIARATKIYNKLMKQYGTPEGYINWLAATQESYRKTLNQAGFYSQAYSRITNFCTVMGKVSVSVLTMSEADALKEVGKSAFGEVMDEAAKGIPDVDTKEFVYSEANAGIESISKAALWDVYDRVHAGEAPFATGEDAAAFIAEYEHNRIGFEAAKMGRLYYYDQLNKSPWETLGEIVVSITVSELKSKLKDLFGIETDDDLITEYAKGKVTSQVKDYLGYVVNYYSNRHITSWARNVERIQEETELLLTYNPYSIIDADISGISNKTYTGSSIKIKPTVKLNGKKLKRGKDYTLKYKNNKNIGTAMIIISGKGKYSGIRKINFMINPKRTTARVLSQRADQFKIKWNRVSNCDGYEIQYGTSADGEDFQSIVISGKKTRAAAIDGLQAGQKYYFHVRAYKKVKDEYYFADWSTRKTATTR